MQPHLFIGSSAEALPIAKALQQMLQGQLQVKLWTTAFETGEYFLERLQKELFLTDFALFIITPDDITHTRGHKNLNPRDNVVFELGMFIGALGLKKSYFVVTDITQQGKTSTVHLPSDLDGFKKTRIKISKDEQGNIEETPANRQEMEEAADKIMADIFKKQEGIMLHLLPSTSLAIGYYKNFILQACKSFSLEKAFSLGNTTYDLTKDIFDFYIIIPDSGSDTSHATYQKFVRQQDLQQIQIKAVDSPRTFPFFVRTSEVNGRLQLYDLPTTLLSSRETIKLVMPHGTHAHEIQQLELKEIANFKNTIEYLLREPESANFRDNIHLVTASELFKTN